jgi:hypothetical protein
MRFVSHGNVALVPFLKIISWVGGEVKLCSLGMLATIWPIVPDPDDG